MTTWKHPTIQVQPGDLLECLDSISLFVRAYSGTNDTAVPMGSVFLVVDVVPTGPERLQLKVLWNEQVGQIVLAFNIETRFPLIFRKLPRQP